MKTILAATAAMLVFAGATKAADFAAPEFIRDWTGFYVGAHGGFGFGSLNDFVTPEVEPEGVFGGLQFGYDHQFANNVVLGLGIDVSLGDVEDSFLDVTDLGVVLTRTVSGDMEAFGSVRGRLGYAFGDILPYVTGGLAWTRLSADYLLSSSLGPALDVVVDDTQTHFGWTVGAGVETMLSERVSAFVEYAYSEFGEEDYAASVAGSPYEEPIEPDLHTVRLGINYRF